MNKKNNNLMTLSEFKDKHYGKRGASKREELEAGYNQFKLGALIHEARLEKGMTQEQLAEKWFWRTVASFYKTIRTVKNKTATSLDLS